MKNLGLKTRLMLAVGFLTLLMIAIGLLGYKGMVNDERSLQTTYTDQVVPLIDLKVAYDSYAVGVVDTCHKLSAETISWEDARKAITAATTSADRSWKAYVETNFSPEKSCSPTRRSSRAPRSWPDSNVSRKSSGRKIANG